MILLAWLGCNEPCIEGFGRDDAGDCVPLQGRGGPHPKDSSVDSEDTADTGDPATWPLGVGDPLEIISDEKYLMWEFLDSEVLDASRGVVVGQGGFGLVDLENSTFLFEENTERGYRLAVDGEMVFVATRTGKVYSVDLSGSTPNIGQARAVGDGWNEDIAADQGLVALASLDSGTLLMDTQFTVLGTIPGAFAYGVGLVGDRAVVADDETVGLWDVSDPANPVLLSSMPLRGQGRDVAFDGAQVAVALGARGVDLFEVDGDTLMVAGELAVPGAASGVDLDGDWLWIGAWDVTALAWIGAAGPRVVGHETFHGAAMGIGAKDGVALVPAWQNLGVVRRTGDVAGPEVNAPRLLHLVQGEQTLRLQNWGAYELEVQLTGAGVSLSPSALTLAPGEDAQVQVVAQNGGQGAVDLTTNDPDETSVQIPVSANSSTLGVVHDDFTLPGFTWPDGTESPVSLSDYEGRPVFIGYWALY